MLGNAKAGHCVIDLFFLFSVNKQLRARTGDTADAAALPNPEQEGLVCHAGLQAADILNPGLRHLKYLGHQLHGRVVRMILIPGVE